MAERQEVPEKLRERSGLTCQLTQPWNQYQGVVTRDTEADILLVDDNPLEDISVIGGNAKWFSAEDRGTGIRTIRIIMKDGRIYKNTL